ncbi:hypothetical protein V8E36_000783 [Tilletia maclaganii]
MSSTSLAAFPRQSMHRRNSSGAASVRSNRSFRASLEDKMANFTSKLPFGRDRRISRAENPGQQQTGTSSSFHDEGSRAAPASSQGHTSCSFQHLQPPYGDVGESPRGSLSFQDIHDEHIVRSNSAGTGPHPDLAPPRRVDSIPRSVLAPSVIESSVGGPAAPAPPPISQHGPASAPSTTSLAGPPANPFKQQMPRILAFFGGTTLAVLVLQRFHSLLAVAVATCAAYVLWVQLERAGTDLLWEAEWRSIESRVQQNGQAGETAVWMNHVLRIVWPLLNTELFTPFIDLLEDSLMNEVQSLGIVHGCRVEDLDQGRTALQIKGFRVLSNDADAFVGNAHASPKKSAGDHEEAQDTGEYINLEVSFSYRGTKRKCAASSKANASHDIAKEVDAESSDMEARENIHMLLYMMVGLQKIAAVELPVWVSVLGIEGKVRLRLQILPNPPFAKTVAITFPSLPALELSARPLGRKMIIDAMQLPLVSTYILHSVENVIKGFIAPRSYTVDVPALLGAADGPQHTYALGVVLIVVHEASHIPAADANGSSDPFVQISFSKAGRPLHRTRVWRRTRDPIWMEWRPLLISPDEVRDHESIRLTIFDADRFSADDALGKVEVSIDRLIRHYHKHEADDDVSRILETHEEPLQPMTRGGKTSGTLKYSAAFFGLAMGEGHSMSPHRKAMLKQATLRSFGQTPVQDAGGRSAFEALKGVAGVESRSGARAGAETQESVSEPKVDLEQFETPFDRFVKNLGLPTDEGLLRQRYERKQRVRHLVEMIEGAEAAHVAAPQEDRPSGILVWHIHSLDALEIPSTQRSLTSKRGHIRNKLSTAEDHSELSGSKKMPSSYVQVVVNDVAMFRTRTKPLNSQPFVNSGSERWVSDWTKTRIDFIVRDARQRESDAIIGVVGLRLVDVLKSAGRITDSWSLTGGVGYGKIRISLLFRSLDVTIPKALSGWNIGVLEVGACRVTGLAGSDFEKRECSLLFDCNGASAETEDANPSIRAQEAGSDAPVSGPTAQYGWSLDDPIKIPVRTRYPSTLFITLRSDRSLGRHITHAFACLPLNRIPDDTIITHRVPLFHTQNLQTFEQETLRAMTADKQLAQSSEHASARRGPVLEEMCSLAEVGVKPKDLAGASIQHVGWLQLTCVFNSGCGPEHRSLLSGDSELRVVYDSLFAAVDAGQRRAPTSLMTRSRRRQLSLELAEPGADFARAGTSGAGADSRERRYFEGNRSTDEPESSASGIDVHVSSPGGHRRVASSRRGGPVAGNESQDSPVSPRTLLSEDEDESDVFGDDAARKRMLKRTERGPAQLGVVRTMAFLKQSGEDAIAKVRTRVGSSASRRQIGGMESEGVSHF